MKTFDKIFNKKKYNLDMASKELMDMIKTVNDSQAFNGFESEILLDYRYNILLDFDKGAKFNYLMLVGENMEARDYAIKQVMNEVYTKEIKPLNLRQIYNLMEQYRLVKFNKLTDADYEMKAMRVALAEYIRTLVYINSIRINEGINRIAHYFIIEKGLKLDSHIDRESLEKYININFTA